jgi:transaldolase
MTKNPLLQLREYGQYVWVDFLSRSFVRSGRLKQLINEDSLSGVTSNPAIFEKVIDNTVDYDSEIQRLQNEGKTATDIYEQIAVSDVTEAADFLWPIFDRTRGSDGYVSLEVSPAVAHNTQGTIQEVKRLWLAIGRPNVMIKIPATKEGLPAIEQCVADGINVNVTLIFGLSRYREVTESYIRGLERRSELSQPLNSIRSVASFFLSRIDVMIEPELDEVARSKCANALHDLRGGVAIASAKLAYQMYKEIFRNDRFAKLEQSGAQRQWLLWGSTSTKTKGWSDVKYVEPLIGPETINSMPPETLIAYRAHGSPAPRLEEGAREARKVLQKLAEVGLNLDEITQKLENEGVEKFAKAFDRLMNRLRQGRGTGPTRADWREEVGGSGVYLVSGPQPKGDAPIVPEPSWGQGKRGSAGYAESGGSELWFKDTKPEQCRDIMTKDPACCSLADVLATAAQIMRDRNIGILPVVEDMQNKKLAGVLTDRDIVVRGISQGLDPNTTMVAQIISREVIWCSPEDDIHKSVEAMETYQLRRIPIVDNSGRVVGIIAQADIALRLRDAEQTAEILQEISKPPIDHAA